jgi:tyrosyl-tRNA synthetase
VAFAQEIVARFHDKTAAARALADFEARFRHGALPEDLPEVKIAADDGGLPLVQALKQAHLTASTSEAIRMIEQGGVKLDGERISDRGLNLAKGTVAVAQVGKRKFARISIV